ncbi:hypothetical protein MANES_14G096100v8 [Manihot esculenta]|uniref:Uncharacterized protein n=1 Tax=Manihot esculenta TaxID=3983 RepID=A0A2C9UJX6_MANES|nr:hypothetical protein MANES_14G096100v8 [Manihot esculenta]
MASSSRSKRLSCNIIYLLFIFALLVSTSSVSARHLTIDKRVAMQPENVKPPHRGLYETSFLYQSQMFNFLPKGVPIPPSGPSKRHNSKQT